MDLSKPTVADVFSAYSQYEIPAYQREYQWDTDRWQGLWRDIGLLYLDRAEQRNALPPHFIGAMIVSQSPSQPGLPTRNSVIDGQQRLVTLCVLLAAIRDAIAERDGLQVVENHRLFWLRHENETIVGPRLEAQKVDQNALHAAMNGGWRAWYKNATSKRALEQARVLYAYTYFRFLIWQGDSAFRDNDEFLPLRRYKTNQHALRAEDVWTLAVGGQRDPQTSDLDLDLLNSVVRDRLFLLNIVVEQSDEDGPTIFDTMNAKRTQLDQWDFIRNSVFIRLDANGREEFFESYWGPAQDALFEASYTGLRTKGRDAFVYDYLIARGEVSRQGTINRNRGHEQLMARVAHLARSGVQLRAFIKDDFLPAAYAWLCAIGGNTLRGGPAEKVVPADAQFARDSIMSLSSGPPIPVMLHYFNAWANAEISAATLIEALKVLESYVARHVICQTPMSPFRAHFMQVMADLDGSTDPADLFALLRPRWKTDAEVRSALENAPMYGTLRAAQLGAVFRGLEQELGGPGGNTLPFGGGSSEYSVEHIYPKSFATNGPNAGWREDFEADGVSAEDVAWMATHVHMIGNLTVVTKGANSRLKVANFRRKRRAIANQDPANPIPPLAVNADIIQAERWTRKQVLRRTALLTAAALSHWPTPADR